METLIKSVDGGGDGYLYPQTLVDTAFDKHGANALQSIAKICYERVIYDKFGQSSVITFMKEHEEVEIIAVAHVPSCPDKIRIKTTVLPIEKVTDGQERYIYVFESFSKDKKMGIVGGIRTDKIRDPGHSKYFAKGKKIGGEILAHDLWVVERSSFNRFGLFDEKIFAEKKNQLALFKRSVDSEKFPMCSYDANTMSLSDPKNVTEPVGFSSEITDSDLAAMVENRGKLMIGYYMIKTSTIPEYIKVDKLQELLSNTMYKEDILFPREKDMVSFGALSAAVIMRNEEKLIPWFIFFEQKLAKDRLRHNYPSEEHIVKCVESNKLKEKFKIVNANELDPSIRNDCMQLFAEKYTGWAPPKKWFLMNWTDCLELSARQQCIIDNGIAYLHYSQVRDESLVQLINANIYRLYSGGDFKKNIANSIRDDPTDRLWKVIKSSSGQTLDVISSMIKEKQTTNNKPKIIGVKDIEDAFSKNIMPPCYALINIILQRNHHLQYNERFNLSTFLNDVGFTPSDSMDYFVKAYEKKSGQELFMREFKSLFTFKENRKGAPCTKLQQRDYINSLPEDVFASCPFASMQTLGLSRLLSEMGVGEIDAYSIMQKTKKEEYTPACLLTMEALSMKNERPFILRRPEQYAVRISELKEEKDTIAKRMKSKRHIEIEYEDADFINEVENIDPSTKKTKSIAIEI